jgi:hypothetical protein
MSRTAFHPLRVVAAVLFVACLAQSCAPDAVLHEPVIDERAAAAPHLASLPPSEPEGGACSAFEGNLPLGECDPYLQDCEEGVCRVEMYLGEYTSRCVPPSEGGALGEACIAGGCQAHLSCIWGRCSVPCCAEDHDPCDQAGGRCTLNVPVGPYVMKVCSFLEPCALFTADACSGNEHCHLQAHSYGDARCIPAADGAARGEGEDCDYVNQCGDSLGCDTGVCRFYCDLADHESLPAGEGGCLAGQRCVTTVEYEPLGYGVCTP